METNLEAPKTSKKFNLNSLFSLVSGVLTYALIFFHTLIDMKLLLAIFLAPIAALAAIFTGHKASRQIRRAEGQMSGKKLAKTGLFLGYSYIIICIILTLLAVLIFGGIASGITSLLGSIGIQ